MTSKPSIFVTELSLKKQDVLLKGLHAQGFEITHPPHTVFCGKKTGVVCTLYQSGKLTVQGKEMSAFIEFFLEPEILQSFTFTNPESKSSNETDEFVPHIGIDESGKGDFFGPLCVAGVFADKQTHKKLQELGVKDSKEMTDASIRKIAQEIRRHCQHQIIKIGPARYNEIYPKFGNLNSLLAWGHATAIENLVERTGCRLVTIDQFANESVVKKALSRKKIKLEVLTQRHRAEEDIVVAAASILAREAFLMGLEALSNQFGIKLPKGASKQTIEAGRKFAQTHGKEQLVHVGKLHFKTLDSI